MSKPQLFFPSDNRTPKHHGCLNTLHQTLGDEFTTCWGRVDEFFVAGEQEIGQTKPFFIPFSSAATCTNHPLEVDQRCFPPSGLNTGFLEKWDFFNPEGPDPVNAMAR
ncbi:hypothetical protein Taro_008374 [Colocasia esculenta]|uniref:Uncharacterized protein n=1 Tax=Colocasia esculenta TaxID=4460 RepID=A0A843U2W4_COLES|nr:hypothetical protein [Colocasia esculenta]